MLCMTVLNIFKMIVGRSLFRTPVIVRSNERLTVREIVKDFDISVGPRHEIPTERFAIHRIAAKFVRPFDICGYDVVITNPIITVIPRQKKKTLQIKR